MQSMGNYHIFSLAIFPRYETIGCFRDRYPFSLVDCLDRLLFVSGSRLNNNKEIQITLTNGQFYLRPFLLYFNCDVVP